MISRLLEDLEQLEKCLWKSSHKLFQHLMGEVSFKRLYYRGREEESWVQVLKTKKKH